MRTLAIACALVGVFSVSTAADAYHERKSKRYSSGEWSQDDSRRVKSERQRRYARDTEADIIRAESCDPGGRFSGYPAWARAAFSCGTRR